LGGGGGGGKVDEDQKKNAGNTGRGFNTEMKLGGKRKGIIQKNYKKKGYLKNRESTQRPHNIKTSRKTKKRGKGRLKL